MPRPESDYESDLTKFLREFLAKHPEELDAQRKGRAMWWDAGARRERPSPARHTPKAGGNEYLFQPLSEKEQESN
jgi:hypothetical protein